MKKIIQTAGRNALEEFAPQFAHFNDDVLFGENWNNHDIDVKTRSIITVVALMASGITDTSLKFYKSILSDPYPHAPDPLRYSHPADTAAAWNSSQSWHHESP